MKEQYYADRHGLFNAHVFTETGEKFRPIASALEIDTPVKAIKRAENRERVARGIGGESPEAVKEFSIHFRKQWYYRVKKQA